jgi:teichuronic acid biosynthesis glycosyltransferase TuaC
MKTLFVVSGNSQFYDVAPFIKAQGDSLKAEGLDLDYFLIKGKGARNYLANIGRLKRQLRENRYDLIHAHYSFCGWVAVLAAGRLPVVLSLMGDDATGTFSGQNRISLKSRALLLLGRLIQPFTAAIISKSPNIESFVYRKKISHLIPNGVKLDQFVEYDRAALRETLGMKKDKQYIVFLGNPKDPNKNYALAQSAHALLKRPNVELLSPFRLTHDEVAQYLNAADVFVMCSFSEGSPNVVKEAMALNCPMVVTPAGDAAWVAGDEPGCFVGGFDPADFAAKLAEALDWTTANGRTAGRRRLIALGLDATSVARRILGVYETVLTKKTRKRAEKTDAAPNSYQTSIKTDLSK